jgi:hypothetical protein
MTRIQSPDHLVADEELERSLRPQGLDDFVGQDAVKDQLAVSLAAAKAAARRSTTSCSPAARPGQDLAGADPRRRARRPVRA